jgi:hypothetical protein
MDWQQSYKDSVRSPLHKGLGFALSRACCVCKPGFRKERGPQHLRASLRGAPSGGYFRVGYGEGLVLPRQPSPAKQSYFGAPGFEKSTVGATSDPAGAS